MMRIFLRKTNRWISRSSKKVRIVRIKNWCLYIVNQDFILDVDDTTINDGSCFSLHTQWPGFDHHCIHTGTCGRSAKLNNESQWGKRLTVDIYWLAFCQSMIVNIKFARRCNTLGSELSQVRMVLDIAFELIFWIDPQAGPVSFSANM